MPLGSSRGAGWSVDQVQVEHKFCGFEGYLDSRDRSKIACSYPAKESGARSNPYHNSALKERKIKPTEKKKISFPLGWKGNSFPCRCPMHPGMGWVFCASSSPVLCLVSLGWHAERCHSNCIHQVFVLQWGREMASVSQELLTAGWPRLSCPCMAEGVSYKPIFVGHVTALAGSADSWPQCRFGYFYALLLPGGCWGWGVPGKIWAPYAERNPAALCILMLD